MADRTDDTRVGRFYSKIARPYDTFATSRLFASLRQEAVDALELAPGDRALEIGCGTGGNIPFIESAMAGNGTYVGVDLSGGMLSRAAGRERDLSVDLLQADAGDPPLGDGFDAILATFVNGVLPDPETAVRAWVSLLRPGGRIVFLDAAGRRNRYSPLEWGFRAFVVLAAPPGTGRRTSGSPNETLIDRVERAHETLAEEVEIERTWTRWRGFVRCTVARRKAIQE